MLRNPSSWITLGSNFEGEDWPRPPVVSEKHGFFLWERHILAAVTFNEGWLPRFYRGWKPLPQKNQITLESSLVWGISMCLL
jgi:hypothetical protein